MKQVETFAVRWHETDATREVRPSALLTYMQESANLQFVKNGKSLDTWRDEAGLAFILSRIAIDFDAPLHAYETVTAETFTCPSKGVGCMRGFRVLRGEETVAKAMSQWALLHLDTRRFCPAAEAPWHFEDEPPVEVRMPLRFRIPRDVVFEEVGKRTITYEDLDYNLHMNNTRYPDMLAGFLPNPHEVRMKGISLAYLKEAAYGATLTVERGEEGEKTYFRAKDGATVCLEAMVLTESRT